MPPLTATTITSPDELRAELAKVRAQGYAIDICERENGLFGVAAPVRDVAGRVIATISFSGPAERINTPLLPAWIEVLRQSADQISSVFGWVGSEKQVTTSSDPLVAVT